jgi:hypothetical protein
MKIAGTISGILERNRRLQMLELQPRDGKRKSG